VPLARMGVVIVAVPRRRLKIVAGGL